MLCNKATILYGRRVIWPPCYIATMLYGRRDSGCVIWLLCNMASM